jgi:hypothetical protein
MSAIQLIYSILSTKFFFMAYVSTQLNYWWWSDMSMDRNILIIPARQARSVRGNKGIVVFISAGAQIKFACRDGGCPQKEGKDAPTTTPYTAPMSWSILPRHQSAEYDLEWAPCCLQNRNVIKQQQESVTWVLLTWSHVWVTFGLEGELARLMKRPAHHTCASIWSIKLTHAAVEGVIVTKATFRLPPLARDRRTLLPS